MNLERLKPGPIRHAQLSLALVLRVETVRSVLGDVLPMSRDEWIDSLKRDLNPEQEVLWWERVAQCYKDFHTPQTLSADERRHVFNVIFGLLSGLQSKDMARDVDKLPERRHY